MQYLWAAGMAILGCLFLLEETMDISLILIYGVIVILALFLLWREGLLDNNRRIAVAVIILAAAFAIRAVCSTVPQDKVEQTRKNEIQWQHEHRAVAAQRRRENDQGVRS